MAWTAIASTRYDADSPADTDLFTDIIANIEHVFDGTDIATDLVTQDSIANNAVGTGELKFTSTTGTIACGNTQAIASVNSLYAHNAKFTYTWVGGTRSGISQGYPDPDASGAANLAGCYIYTNADGSSPNPATITYNMDYHAACPPYAPFVAGGKNVGVWGSFVHVLRDKATGEIYCSQMAQDPSWYRGEDFLWDASDPIAIAMNPQPPVWIDLPPETLEHVLIDTREVCLSPMNFCRHLLRAEFLERMAEDKTPDLQLVLRQRAEEERKRAKPVKMDGRDALLATATALGMPLWDLFAKKHPKLLHASEQAKENGKPIVTGVESYDSVVTIVSAR